MQRWLFRVGLVLLALGSPAAQSAGIDCTKARSPTEKAICASPGLRALDQQVAAASAEALARSPERADAMRQDLLGWLKQRDATCGLPSAEIAQCLTTQLTARLAALAPPPAAAPPTQTSTAPTRPADPAIPAATFPPGVATLDQATEAAAEHAETLLHVTVPGRFTIAARSASGAALQLVDKMTGLGETKGEAGAQDGRIDALLDVGTYKLRVRSAKGAAGDVALRVSPFHEAAPPAALPPAGFPLAATLADGEQRAFWLAVPPDGAVRIEAAGRALADLRLWRDGHDLAALDPAATRTEPVPGHPLTDLRLEGRVEPGTYLAVVYGGPPLPWTDNDASQPLLLRAGASTALAEGWAGGQMGPFGSEVYSLPPATGLVRLRLPAAAIAELRAGDASATLARSSREPSVSLDIAPKTTPVVELRAAAGQPFTLQALELPDTLTITRPGRYWVSAIAAGAGGDEVPAGVLLTRTEGEGKPPRIVASTLPTVGAGAAWHARFNLRGETMLPVQNTAGGALAVRTSGVKLTERTQAGQYDLPADYYFLTLSPIEGAVGNLDLTIGPPGAPAPPPRPLPPDPVIPLGLQTLEPGQHLRLLGPVAPGLRLGLSARPAPVALAEGPLTIAQVAGTSLAIPVKLAPGGTLAVSEVGGGPVPYGLQDPGTVVLPITDHARSVVLAWRRTVTPAAIPAPAAAGGGTSLTAGTPVFFDLREGETRGFDLTVPDGGQYRVETSGRLHTAGRIGTPFLPRFDERDGNGTGQNVALWEILRAGRFRVEVTAKESAGHLGLLASPVPVFQGAELRPGGSVRASIPAGSAAIFPIVVDGPGERYRLEAASLGDPWGGRIEDSEGWPVTATGRLDGSTPTLPPGRYRLVVPPDDVGRQLVARLTAIVPEPDITGHGPHPLPFETPQAAVWRESPGREPDVWTFALAGPAQVTLMLGDGMQGVLHRGGETTRIVGTLTTALEAGRYQVEATSLGRNDRLAYTIALTSPALQPGVARVVTLPGTAEFALAEARVASLTTYGRVPVKGVLRRAGGAVVARVGARADDWNIAASRLLDAGHYTLELAPASPPELSPIDRTSQGTAGEEAPEDDQEAQSPPGQPPSEEAAQAPDEPPALTTELRLVLPDALPPVPAPASAAPLDGAGVHVLSLNAPPPGSLVVATATSAAPIVLALERQVGPGWRVVALEEGLAPAVASPADTEAAAWRLEAWTVDGGAEPIRLATRAIELPEQSAGDVTLAPLQGMAIAAARVGLGAPAPVSVAGAVLAGGWPGQALAAANGPVLLQGTDLWLLGRGPVHVTPVPWTGVQTLVIPPGQMAQLPEAERPAMWRAQGGFGQPGLGAAAGIASLSAVARADAPVTLRNASGNDTLRVALTRQDFNTLPSRPLEGALQLTLAPGAAVPVTLPPGDKLLQVDAGAGVAAFAGQSTFWSGDAPLSRSMAGAWTEVLLVNAGTAPAPVSLATQPALPAVVLRPGTVVKRFFGAAGSVEMAFAAPEGARLQAAGEATLTAVAADGGVQTGTDLAAAGAGRVVVTHEAGPVAVWLALPDSSPWPTPAAQNVQTPARLTLQGEAMALAMTPDTPSLLHLSTTAPVLASVSQDGRTDPPRMFPAGAELFAVVAPGPAELRLYSPTDGPLAGTATLTTAPVKPIAEGLGAPVIIPPGGMAAFGFDLAKPATIGVGVRAEPDAATVRLLDAKGAVLGTGVAQLRTLPAGRYVLEAAVPPGGPPTTLRPAVVGITPRGAGPPPEVVQHYLELAGLKPQETKP